MRTRQDGCVYECVLIDLNTQEDFFDEDRPCRVMNASRLVPALRNIIAWAKRNQVPVVSSMDSHRPEEMEMCGLPPHCLDGSHGQHKLRFTLLRNRVAVEGDNTLALPLDLFQHHQQVIFRNRSVDLLGNPKADRLLTQLIACEYIIFGLGLERSIKAMALGLMARNRHVTVVSDGCGYWNTSTGEFALRQIAAKGASLITVAQLLARKLARPRRYSRLLNAPGQTPGMVRLGVYPISTPPGSSGRNGRARTNRRSKRPPQS